MDQLNARIRPQFFFFVYSQIAGLFDQCENSGSQNERGLSDDMVFAGTSIFLNINPRTILSSMKHYNMKHLIRICSRPAAKFPFVFVSPFLFAEKLLWSPTRRHLWFFSIGQKWSRLRKRDGSERKSIVHFHLNRPNVIFWLRRESRNDATENWLRNEVFWSACSVHRTEQKPRQ